MIVLGSIGRGFDARPLTLVQLATAAVVCGAVGLASERPGLPTDRDVSRGARGDGRAGLRRRLRGADLRPEAPLADADGAHPHLRAGVRWTVRLDPRGRGPRARAGWRAPGSSSPAWRPANCSPSSRRGAERPTVIEPALEGPPVHLVEAAAAGGGRDRFGHPVGMLFDRPSPRSYTVLRAFEGATKWGHSSAGRALGWQPRGQGFDPPWLHHREH